MLELEKPAFDAEAFLASAGFGRRVVKLRGKQTFFSQGESADSVFYLQSGRAKLTVVSKNGKKATITHLSAGEFVGEESLATTSGLHRSTFTSIIDCTVLQIEREEMIRALHEEHSLSQIFMQFLVARRVRLHSDLADQLFDSTEKRLARILLLMAEFGEPGESGAFIPEIMEESLSKMNGTPPSSVGFFMNRFREFGLIDYDGHIRVHKALLNVILRDQMPGDNAAQFAIIDKPRRQSKSAESAH